MICPTELSPLAASRRLLEAALLPYQLGLAKGSLQRVKKGKPILKKRNMYGTKRGSQGFHVTENYENCKLHSFSFKQIFQSTPPFTLKKQSLQCAQWWRPGPPPFTVSDVFFTKLFKLENQDQVWVTLVTPLKFKTSPLEKVTPKPQREGQRGWSSSPIHFSGGWFVKNCSRGG